jgi:hypothetical protein
MIVAHFTQGLLHVLPMSNLQSSRVLCCFLVHLPRVLLASFFIFLDKGLPYMGGTYNSAHCILTKVYKSWVFMTNN